METMSFPEAMELCNFGAKVIYPPTLYPVYHRNIPIVVKNTFNPEAPGTLISTNADVEQGKVKGISSVKDVGIVSVGEGEELDVASVDERIFNALAQNGIGIYMMTDNRFDDIDEFDYTRPSRQIVVKGEDLKRTREILAKEFSLELRNRQLGNIRTITDLSMVAVVGTGIGSSSELLESVVDTLRLNNFQLLTHNQCSADTNLSFIIRADSLNGAINAIHEKIFE